LRRMTANTEMALAVVEKRVTKCPEAFGLGWRERKKQKVKSWIAPPESTKGKRDVIDRGGYTLSYCLQYGNKVCDGHRDIGQKKVEDHVTDVKRSPHALIWWFQK
jgi:hypothetical protein